MIMLIMTQAVTTQPSTQAVDEDTIRPAHERNADDRNLDRLALSATLHCLTGCGIGEVLGLVIGTALSWGTLATLALAVGLAFAFGYALTIIPLLRSGVPMVKMLSLAFAADTLAITIMEIVDNGVILLIPGASDAGLGSWLFWGSLGFALIVAALAVYPVNRWLIARGRGHAVAHAHHELGHDRQSLKADALNPRAGV
jgi:hypothetical protein